MKNSNLTYSELIHHLDLHTTDPMVRRLIDIILNGDGIMESLVGAGMDPTTHEFQDSYSYYSPGDYIGHLKNECDNLEQELHIAQNEVADLTKECEQLRARSVADLLSEMEHEVRMAKRDRAHVQDQCRALQEQNAELNDKINVWHILER